MASALLGYLGQSWIDTPNDKLGGRRPLDMAKDSEAELVQALDELNRELARRQAERKREEELQSLQYDLEYWAREILGEAAMPFLGSPYPLGPHQKRQTPRDYCVSRAALQECLDLAKKVQRGRR